MCFTTHRLDNIVTKMMRVFKDDWPSMSMRNAWIFLFETILLPRLLYTSLTVLNLPSSQFFCFSYLQFIQVISLHLRNLFIFSQLKTNKMEWFIILCFYDVLKFLEDVNLELGLEEVDAQGIIVWKHKRSPTKNETRGFPGGAVVENLPANTGDTGSSPGLGRSHMPRSN